MLSIHGCFECCDKSGLKESFEEANSLDLLTPDCCLSTSTFLSTDASGASKFISQNLFDPETS